MEHESYWDEVAAELLKTENEAEERKQRQRDAEA